MKLKFCLLAVPLFFTNCKEHPIDSVPLDLLLRARQTLKWEGDSYYIDTSKGKLIFNVEIDHTAISYTSETKGVFDTLMIEEANKIRKDILGKDAGLFCDIHIWPLVHPNWNSFVPPYFFRVTPTGILGPVQWTTK